MQVFVTWRGLVYVSRQQGRRWSIVQKKKKCRKSEAELMLTDVKIAI